MLSQLINWLKLGLTSWYAVCLLKQLKDVWHWTWWVHKVLSLKTELFKPGAWDWTHSSDRCKVGWECKLDGHDRRLVYIWLIMSVDSCKIQVDVVRMSPPLLSTSSTDRKLQCNSCWQPVVTQVGNQSI